MDHASNIYSDDNGATWHNGTSAATGVNESKAVQRSTGRNDLTVRVSRDDGASRPEAALLKPGAAGYSTMAVLADGSVGDLYEIGDTGGTVFTRFALPSIES
ncbi:exo-alpha-sialidase [Actinomadura sp. KC345]|uniref:sialidase family protein n=1 Tax=Actinomadura sp. KC345 TaxID=2530371 RepID=UPI001051937A|nr:sialidase family protein [Actinomadura sp. KC345]TDC44941.1 exo-alpha-sialidase [Actinomadura sp. KC345]